MKDILDNLTKEEQNLYRELRTRLRGAYLKVVESTVGMIHYDSTDDTFMDILDTRLNGMFARRGSTNELPEITEAELLAGLDKSFHLSRHVPNEITKHNTQAE